MPPWFAGPDLALTYTRHQANAKRDAGAESLSRMAVAEAQMGGKLRAVIQTVGPQMMMFELTTAQDARDTAEGIRHNHPTIRLAAVNASGSSRRCWV